MTDKKILQGHICALVTIFIWGTTFISTKYLLDDFAPAEILVFRFFMGFLVLQAVYLPRLKVKERKQELYFAGAGLCGVTLYFLLENIALTYTFASNVGVLISASPFFTAICVWLFMGRKPLSKWFFAGFLLAISGIILINFNGSTVLKLNPTGDILALLAALVWAFYSVLTKKISSFGYHTVAVTRRIFGYGLLFMIPPAYGMGFRLGLDRFARPELLLNILFLGLAASALCFVTWNYAVKILGAVKTSIYIYLVPVITLTASALVLKEKITWLVILGTGLILAGLFLSEKKEKGDL